MSYRDDLLALFQKSADQALKPKAVKLKGWGTVYVRALTVAEVSEAKDDGDDKDDKDKKDKSSLARGALRLLCDAEGKRMFEANDQVAIQMLMAQPWTLLRQLLQASDEDIAGEDAEKK